MKGKYLTQFDRFYIEKQLADGFRQVDIVRELVISPSTVSQELKRNTGPTFNTLYSVLSHKDCRYGNIMI